MHKVLPKTFFLLLIMALSMPNLLAQCPNCETTLPSTLAEDTLFLSPMVNGEVGIYYQEDLSFRMPLTTDPVNAIDPSVPSGLDVQEITLLSIANVPPGLSWEANETMYIPEDNSDGCLRFCGTPLVSGVYTLEVTVAAKVSIITQTTTFTLELIVLPSSSTTEGFTMNNNIACGEAVVAFENNIVSNGEPGFSYFWEFGNGNATLNEQPAEQVYNTPGIYEVQYQAIVDTVGYVLTNIEVLTSDCTDFPTFPNFSTAPDLNITVYDPDSNIVFETPNFDNTFPPVSASLFLPMGEGNYTIEVIDDDSGINLGDDECGLVSFNKFASGVMVSGEFSMELTILHPVDTIISVDTIYVYELPATPLVNTTTTSTFCNGDTIFLETDYDENLFWYQDSILLNGENEPLLMVTTPGAYWVEYFDANGCSAVSDPFEVNVISVPASPAFVNENNLLSVFEVDLLPTDYQLQWFQDGVALDGETGLSYCIQEFGTYTLEVLDNATGCSNSFASTVPYNPQVECATPIESVLLSDRQVRVFPNPMRDLLQIELNDFDRQDIQISIIDLLGVEHWTIEQRVQQSWQTSADVQHLPSGIYFLRMRTGDQQVLKKLIKQ